MSRAGWNQERLDGFSFFENGYLLCRMLSFAYVFIYVCLFTYLPTCQNDRWYLKASKDSWTW